VRRGRILLWLLAAVLLLAAMLGAWLMHTESGLRFVFARTQSALPGLTAARISGTLAGTTLVDRLDYRSDSVHVQVKRVRGTIEIAPLLVGRISLESLELDAPQVMLKKTAKGAQSETAGKVSLPGVRIERLLTRDLLIQRVGTEPLSWSLLDTTLDMHDALIELERLKLQQGEYMLSGAIDIDLNDPWWVQRADLSLVTAAGAATPVQARLSRAAHRTNVPIELQLDQPIKAFLQLQPGKRFEDFSAKLSLPAQDATRYGLAVDMPLQAELTLNKSADRVGVTGMLEVGPHRAAIGEAKLQWLATGVKIDALPVTIENLGTLEIHGVLPFSAEESLALDISSESLQFRPAGQKPLRVMGTLQAGGRYSDLSIVPSLRLLQDGLPPGALNGSLQVTAQAIRFEALKLQLPRGTLAIDGTLARDATAQANLTLNLNDFDPALFFPDWSGQLSGNTVWNGTWTSAGASGILRIVHIDGQLREQAFALEGQLQFVHSSPRETDANGQLGSARFSLKGDIAGPGTLSASFDAPDLGELHPLARGRFVAKVVRASEWRVDAQGQELKWDSSALDSLDFSGSIGSDADPTVDLTAQLQHLRHGDIAITSAELALVGTQRGHALRMRAGSERGDVNIAANGGWENGRWSGIVQTLDLSLSADRGLRLRRPVTLQAGAGFVDMSQACWSGKDGAQLCLRGQYQAGSGEIALDAGALPLSWLSGLLDDADYALQDAVVQGHAGASWTEGQLRKANINLTSAQGRLLVRERADLVLGYSNLVVSAQFDGTSGTATASTGLLPDGQADARFQLQRDASGALSYDGNVTVLIRQLDAIEAFTNEIVNPTGQINGQFQLQQDAAGFRLGGAIALSQFKAEAPSLGLSLTNGSMALAGVPEGLILRGAIQSGEGVLTIDGRWNRAAAAAQRKLTLTIAGKNVLISNTPELSLTATPKLQLERDDNGWNLTGTLDIPRARIQADQLDTSTRQSSDVVVIDDPPNAVPAEKWRARVNVRMGDDVKLKGFGFDGKLRGQLEVRQSNGRSATGTGQLGVTGLYNAYGQKLNVARGELLFAGTRLDEPAVSVRAERKVGDSTAGIEITGTAHRLISRVYARPARSESEALSLLVTGRSLRDVRGGDANRLSGAALALGTIGGDMLAKNLGLDELGVSSNSGLQGEAFTIGKFLSPRLYVGYGIGLLTRGEVFTVRYLINAHVDVEANIGERQRASVNYRIER